MLFQVKFIFLIKVNLKIFILVDEEDEEAETDEEEEEKEKEQESDEEIEYVEDFEESDAEDMEDMGVNISDEEEIIKSLPSKKRLLELEYEPSVTKTKERLKNRRQSSSSGTHA
jgi:protein MAK16